MINENDFIEQQKKYNQNSEYKRKLVFIGDDDLFLNDSLIKKLKNFEILQVITSQHAVSPNFHPLLVTDGHVEYKIREMLKNAEEIIFFFISSRNHKTSEFVIPLINSEPFSCEHSYCAIDIRFVFLHCNITENGYEYVIYKSLNPQPICTGRLNAYLEDLANGIPLNELDIKYRIF